MLPFITDTNRKYKRKKKQNKHCGSRGETGSREMWCTDAPCVDDICVFVLQRLELCQRPACCIQQRCGCKSGGDRILGRIFFFFCCPENRPWFPGTMQLMRVSPRKIRLWHHGFLKHTAEPTLSPAIIKPQWISTVDWNWERGRISLLKTLFFCFDLTANILVVAWGSRCTFWTLPFTSNLGSRWQ